MQPFRHSNIAGRYAVLLSGLLAFIASAPPAAASTHVFSSFSEIELPLAAGAQEPSLFAMADGRIALSWTEPAAPGFAVRTAIGDRTGWSVPQTVVASDRLFVNWADFPSVTAFDDGTLAVHWLMQNGPSSYDYDTNIALSADAGVTWGDPVIPHSDRSRRQHGFVTMLPVAPEQMIVIWLDGRAYDINAKGAAENAFINAAQLRVTTIGTDGSQTDDTLLDIRTCTCCQTSAAVTGEGTVLVVYRDRTGAEIRDISVLRRVNGDWIRPTTVHDDGWEISGCPVNGPAIDAAGDRAVVAWFTGANGEPVVKIAFSDDAGASFDAPLRVDAGDAAGRVDVLQLLDGSAVVSWVEWIDTGEALMVCRARVLVGCGEPQVITVNDATGSINFPRMVQTRDGVYIAWTQPLDAEPGLDVTVRMVLARL